MSSKFIFTSLMLLVASNAAFGQIRLEEENYIREATKILASDEFAGRKPMSSQEHLTLDYIIQEYQKVGLKPGYNGEWLQPVKMISTTTKTSGGAINLKGKKAKLSLKTYDDYLIWSFKQANQIKLKNLEYVFCGHGITAPEFGWDDYEGIDVKDKIVIVVATDPGYFDDSLFHGKNVTYYSRQWVKWDNALAHGAAGCILIHEDPAASYQWETLQGSQNGVHQSLIDDEYVEPLNFQGWMSYPAAERLFAAGGFDLGICREAAHKKGFKSFSLNVKSDVNLEIDYSVGQSYNVVGLIEGTDLADECVIYTSHWDHFGIGEPDETGDNIYNGASDSATGVAALFVVAGKYMRCPVKPRRSILFVAVTGEESGFLGSEWYCDHPIFPLEKTAVNINMDGPGPFERTYDIFLRAPGISTAEKWLFLVAETQGREVKPYPVDSNAIYYRCDHISFARHGVPALFFDKGHDFVDKERHASLPKTNSYHKPNDEYKDWWVFDGCMENLNVYYTVGLLIANDDELPQWSETSEFQRGKIF